MSWQRFEHDGYTKVDLRIADRLQHFYELHIMAELLARRALIVAARNDGIIPLNALDEVGRDIPNLRRHVTQLVTTGVWTDTEWGWAMDVGKSRHCRRKPDDRWKLTADLRERVLEHDDYRCQACGASGPLVIDHIDPVSRGGKTIFANLQALCAPCNGSKGTRTWQDFLGTAR